MQKEEILVGPEHLLSQKRALRASNVFIVTQKADLFTDRAWRSIKSRKAAWSNGGWKE